MQQITQVPRFQAARRQIATHQRTKWVIVLWSVVTFVLGLWLLARPDLTTAGFVRVMGAFLLTGAGCEIVGVVLSRGGEESQTCLLFGVLGLLAGVIVLGNYWLEGPMSVPSQSYLLGGVALLWGLIKMLDQGSGDRESWGEFVLGMLHFLLGIFLLLNPTQPILGFLAILGVVAMLASLIAIVVTIEARPAEFIW